MMKHLIISLLAAGLLLSCSHKLPLKDFQDLPDNARPEAVGKRISELFLTTDPMLYSPKGYNGRDRVGGGHWTTYSVVSLWKNALEFSSLTRDKDLENRLIEEFEPFFNERKDKCNRDDHVDPSIFGIVPMEIYLHNGDKRARELGLHYADHQWADPVGNPGEAVGGNGNFPIERQRELLAQGYSPQTRLWIDDMYMITALQCQAYQVTGDRKYIDRTAKEMVMYLDTLQQDNGLFYHAPDVPFFWGRGDGWMAAGLPMLIRSLPKDSEYYPALCNAYRKMMESLLKYQHENGLWGQVLDDPEFWEESSCSAMFTYAFIEGIRCGLLDEATYGPAARKAWIALCGKLDKYGNIADVCVGTNRKNSRDWYMERPRVDGDPHGQAPMLWIVNALLRP